MDKLQIANEKWNLEIANASDFLDTPDDLSDFELKYNLAEPNIVTCSLSLSCKTEGGQRDCLILAGGAPTGVNQHSALLLGEALYLAIGNQVCNFSLPSLDLLWHKKSDSAACLGLYTTPAQDCLIVHGECEITRLALDGHQEWIAGGRDIFNEGFQLSGTQIEVIDFNHVHYRIDLSNGQIEMLKDHPEKVK